MRAQITTRAPCHHTLCVSLSREPQRASRTATDADQSAACEGPPWQGRQKRAISDRFVTFFTYPPRE